MSNNDLPISNVLKELNISIEDASLALNSLGLEFNSKKQSYIDSNTYSVLKNFFLREELSIKNSNNTTELVRLNKVIRECNISLDRAVQFFYSKGHEVDPRPTTKISMSLYNMLMAEFSDDKEKKSVAKNISIDIQKEKRKRILVSPKQKKKKTEAFKKASIKKSKTGNKFKHHCSKEPHINEGQHRVFRVKDQKDTVTILEDIVNLEEHAYKKLDLKVDDILILFIEEAYANNKYRFQYSLLNKFEKGNEYEFQLKEKKENGFLIFHKDYFSFIPPSFGDLFDEDKIKLVVKEVDLDKNNLFYQSINSDQKDPKLLLTAGKIYDFNVTGSFESEFGATIMHLEHKGIKATVKALSFQTESLPIRVSCLVQQIEGHKIRVVQDKYNLLKDLYQEGRNYDFQVTEIKEDENTGEDYYLLIDEFGFYHRFFANEYVGRELDKIEVGKLKQFHVKRINDKGYLILYINTSENEGNFYSAEEVFEAIGLENKIKELFYDFRELLIDERYQKQSFSNLFNDYDNQENLWLFSYLSFIESYRINLYEKNDWDLAIELTVVYIAVEEWMLEGSDFLSNFSQEKKDLTIQKAERRLEKVKFELQALRMVADKNGKNFIREINNKINKSGYLRADNLGVFKALLRINPDLLESNDSEIVSVLVRLLQEGRLEKYEYSHYSRILEKRLAREKYHLNFSLIKKKNQEFDQETLTSIKDILRLMALQIYLANKSGNDEYSVLKSATLLRYLSFLSNNKEHKDKLLNHAISCLTSNNSISLKLEEIENIDKFSIDEYLSEIDSIPGTFKGELLFNYGGSVYKTDAGIALVSPTQNYIFNNKQNVQLTKNGYYFGNRIVIGGLNPKLKLNDLDNFDSYKENWGAYFSKIEGDLKNSSEKAALPNVGDVVRVKAKNYHKTNKNLLFLQIVDDQFSGEGILHVSQTSKIILEGLDGIINPGEIFQAKVIENDNGRIAFSLLDQVWEYGKKVFNESDVVNGKVIKISNNIAFISCENGLPASIYVNKGEFQLEESKVYKFRITNPIKDDFAHYSAQFISETDIYFDQKRVYREFLDKYILEDEDEQLLDLDYNSKSKFKFIYELVLVVENILAIEEKPEKKLEYLYLAKFLTSILKHHRSYYFDAQINFLHQTNVFKKLSTDENFVPDNYVESKTIENFESLELINDYYKVLKYFNKKNVLPELLELKGSTNNSEVTKLIHSVLAYNLIKDEFPDDKETLQRTKFLIYSHIANEKLNTANELLDPLENQSVEIDLKPEEEINLGLENKVKEFKTSYIYYAGSHSIDLQKQSDVILKVIAGFLNQAGGNLYLGVNDTGEVVGLSEDYKHFKNADKYERAIRKDIVKTFNKDINGAIDFEFNKSGDKEYLSILIPQFDEPVPFGNDFYQRQGNETRILKGDDLSKFFKRKYLKNSEL